ncbi:hypothetical protein H6F76_22120 [Leptolyngbya sp. FACHB-321]|uniref:hypothetical protein n=1 Tax=Leptolyngbya sp. FACHB-321 TaxID=2692807 RepID=UPI001686AB2C|nr:hypothetical protein [Leptolyngbya sp. FACHB-321]MBD2037658.1 hypothetical protein [Leptolyngbya sp. FACHB-321]
MEAERAENVPPSPLLQCLTLRHTQPGVVNLSRYSSESTGLPGWIVQRSTLVEQLQTRYSNRDTDSASTELALATAAPAPIEAISRSPSAAPTGAIAPSIPLAAEAPVSPEPLPLSHAAIVLAPSLTGESEPATAIAAPETISSFNASNESIGEGAIGAITPSSQYRLRRVSANPTTPLDTIQRKPLVDESSTAIFPISPVQSFHETASIGSEAVTPASTDTSSEVDLATPALEPMAAPMSIAPINTLQPGVNTAQTTVVFRQLLSEARPMEGRGAAIDPPSLSLAQPASVEVPIARSLVHPASLLTPPSLPIVQRSTDTDSLARATGFSLQPPDAMASAPSISALPLQPSLIWRREDAVTNGFVQRRRQPELPLTISTGSGVTPTIARQTEPMSTSSIDAGSSPSSSLAPPAPLPSSGVPVGQIAEQVSRILFRQLTVERERRGMSQWS